MKRRVFVAINLPKEIKEKLASFQLKWPELPCRWTKKDNLHVTLAFLGYLTDEETAEVCQEAKEVGLRHSPFFVNLRKIVYGPQKAAVRLVWAEGAKSEELAKLRDDLEGELIGLSSELESERGRGYIPHITLGRLRRWEFRKIEPEERPEINEDISLSFEVSSVEVMESRLKRGGAEYAVLESCQLSK
ncbi:MAG: 2'-5' RNA ligase [Parcubacteria group bacterium Gr01-1014_30]|nr:MAG: 2'-5' RNA ligase [Parcubacteria group bacterium Gr01-1014_30]